MNDLHELQLPANSHGHTRWRMVNTTKSEQPEHRFCHVGVVAHGKCQVATCNVGPNLLPKTHKPLPDTLWVHGGYSGSDRLDDFIKFDFAVYDLSFEVPSSTIVSLPNNYLPLEILFMFDTLLDPSCSRYSRSTLDQIQDFRAMINDTTLSDITFVVEGREIYAHKLMLVRCSYFQSLFLGPMKESTMSTIEIDQVRYPIFMSVLDYLYTDQVNFPLSDAMELFQAADLFCIPRLKTICEKRMLQSITVDNAASIFHAADTHSAVALRQKARKYILAHFEEVSKSKAFEEMGRMNIELLFEILQSR